MTDETKPDYPNARDCEHGQLRRSCERCEDAARIAELEAEVGRLRQEVTTKCGAREFAENVAQFSGSSGHETVYDVPRWIMSELARFLASRGTGIAESKGEEG